MGSGPIYIRLSAASQYCNLQDGSYYNRIETSENRFGLYNFSRILSPFIEWTSQGSEIHECPSMNKDSNLGNVNKSTFVLGMDCGCARWRDFTVAGVSNPAGASGIRRSLGRGAPDPGIESSARCTFLLGFGLPWWACGGSFLGPCFERFRIPALDRERSSCSILEDPQLRSLRRDPRAFANSHRRQNRESLGLSKLFSLPQHIDRIDQRWNPAGNS